MHSDPPVAPPSPSSSRPRLRGPLDELAGAAQLITDGVVGLTSVVEAMHAGIARAPVGPAPLKAGGLSGFVYGCVRGVARVSGGAAVGVLRQAGRLGSSPAHGADLPAGARRAAWVSALNGAVGDHLAATGNPLALPMELRHAGLALDLRADALRQALPAATGRLLVLLHGLGMNDRQWRHRGHDHGQALAAAGGYTPVYVRYNTGLPVHANGEALADRLAALLAAWPAPVERVVLLAHSMGGLVARSALHHGQASGQAWVDRVDDLVCLGTPHLGAPLERAGHVVDRVLGAAPYAAPLARLGRLRSAGVVDLRHGRIGRDDRPVPLPDGVRCHAVAACLGEPAAALKPLRSRVLGDGLVPVDSALGRHADATRHLGFAPERQAVLHGMGHLALLSRPEVTRLLARWLC